MWKFYEIHAKQVLNVGDGWHLGSIECVAGGDLAEVLQCPIVARGKNKGKPNWRRKTNAKKVVLADHRGWRRVYCATRGICYECGGEGKKLVRWTSANGPEHKQCQVCQGTGKGKEG